MSAEPHIDPIYIASGYADGRIERSIVSPLYGRDRRTKVTGEFGRMTLIQYR